MSQFINVFISQIFILMIIAFRRLQPQRIHLRTKRVKRCRSCRHILIKPEQKAQSTKFKIKLVAL